MRKRFALALLELGCSCNERNILIEQGELIEVFGGMIPKNIGSQTYPIYESDDAYFHFDGDIALILKK
ncbi:MAG: hypothetical protein PHE67_00475 [Campylobacterales bacterium]|nr:hypothetical protein [Campylobacterales bacterium]